jgi:hypothetical protein
VWGAEVRRGETLPFRIEPEAGQSPENLSEPASSRSDPWDVLQEHEAGSHHSDDVLDLGPEPPFVVGTPSLAGTRERLAGEPGRDEIHPSAPRRAIEGDEVVPHRSRIQDLVFHPRHEAGRRVGVPLNCTHHPVSDPELVAGETEAEFEAADSGAERESVEGTWSHISAPLDVPYGIPYDGAMMNKADAMTRPPHCTCSDEQVVDDAGYHHAFCPGFRTAVRLGQCPVRMVKTDGTLSGPFYASQD